MIEQSHKQGENRTRGVIEIARFSSGVVRRAESQIRKGARLMLGSGSSACGHCGRYLRRLAFGLFYLAWLVGLRPRVLARWDVWWPSHCPSHTRTDVSFDHTECDIMDLPRCVELTAPDGSIHYTTFDMFHYRALTQG